MATSNGQEPRLRVGIPYRTYNEQVKNIRGKYEMYVRSVENAGGAAVPIELNLSAIELERQARELDAIVLPGSPADVDPARYHSARRPQTADADGARETTDFALLQHCFDEGKPVLAICYGVQILNVYLGGSLIQDIPSEVQTTIQHPWNGREHGEPEPFHSVTIETASRMALAPGKPETRVNSSHHQSIREPGRGLRVTARASDGIIEAVEWIGDANWVTGVQWHPERMADDALTQKLFEDLAAAARNAAVRG
ncbi:MAG: gamma-glutamyl-gamma-aminobutyrate hydrolase family protein [Candidatus Acidiferrales bacterium]